MSLADAQNDELLRVWVARWRLMEHRFLTGRSLRIYPVKKCGGFSSLCQMNLAPTAE